MVDMHVVPSGDCIIITMDPGQPIELGDLSQSFAALARLYERHHRKPGDEAAPKLYVRRLDTGSVIAEIVPMAFFMGALAVMDGGLVVSEFTSRIWRTIKYFSGTDDETRDIAPPDPLDASDIREFTKPLLAKNGACLGIKHARFEKGEGDKRTVVEYRFDETELNRAAIRMGDGNVLLPPISIDTAPALDHKLHTEVMLFLEQANKGPGKEAGRTGDKGKIPDISEKIVPVYFAKRVQALKQRMMLGTANPFETVFVVDVHATISDGDVKGYTVSEIHESFPRE